MSVLLRIDSGSNCFTRTNSAPKHRAARASTVESDAPIGEGSAATSKVGMSAYSESFKRCKKWKGDSLFEFSMNTSITIWSTCLDESISQADFTHLAKRSTCPSFLDSSYRSAN